jgi:hypothetical protein
MSTGTLPPDAHGSYKFGELTARFLRLDASERQAWLHEVNLYPEDVQEEIKRHIVCALTHKGSDGKDNPIPIKFKWSGGARPAVKVTYDPAPAGPMFTIEIVGLPPPMASALADRRGQKKKYQVA